MKKTLKTLSILLVGLTSVKAHEQLKTMSDLSVACYHADIDEAHALLDQNPRLAQEENNPGKYPLHHLFDSKNPEYNENLYRLILKLVVNGPKALDYNDSSSFYIDYLKIAIHNPETKSLFKNLEIILNHSSHLLHPEKINFKTPYTDEQLEKEVPIKLVTDCINFLPKLSYAQINAALERLSPYENNEYFKSISEAFSNKMTLKNRALRVIIQQYQTKNSDLTEEDMNYIFSLYPSWNSIPQEIVLFSKDKEEFHQKIGNRN